MKRSFVVLAVFVLAGCSVGPNYKAPQTKVPPVWSAAPEARVDPAELAKWWVTLQDPVLNSLIERAIAHNPDLRFAQARIREARARRGIVSSDRYPNVNATASYERSRSDSTNNVEGEFFQAGFDASWELDVFGRIRRNVEAANADIGAEIENRRDVLVTLLAEVARNYIELRSSQRQIEIARANLKAQQDTLDLTHIRFDAGLVSALDVARAEAQVQTTAAQIPSLEISARQSIHLLSVLLGREPSALVAELKEPNAIPAAPPSVPVVLPSEVLRRRPDVRRAERELAAATARIGVATADLFPKFSLTAFLGLLAPGLSKLTDSDSAFWSITPGVSLPVFNRGRIRGNVAVQNALEEQALISYEQTVLTSLREVEDALIAFSGEQSRRTTLAGAVDANRRAVDLANQLYKQGLTDFLTVLQAQRDLFASEDAFVQSDRNVSSDFVALYKALGGGWEIEAAAEPLSPFASPGSRIIDLTKQ